MREEHDSALHLSQYPTLKGDGTDPGLIMGSAGYMSPEQARGKPTDRRADIWAFGVVMFEMLTGRRAFAGETVSDSLVKILEREPDWHLLPPRTPSILRKLVQRCLKKDLRERLQSIGDARNTLVDLLMDPAALEQTELPETTKPWKRIALGILVPLVFLAGWLARPASAPISQAIQRFEISLPSGKNLAHAYRRGVAMSPDGARLAFVAKSGVGTSAEEQANSELYIRSVDEWDAVPLPGTKGCGQSVFLTEWPVAGFLFHGRPHSGFRS